MVLHGLDSEMENTLTRLKTESGIDLPGFDVMTNESKSKENIPTDRNEMNTHMKIILDQNSHLIAMLTKKEKDIKIYNVIPSF
jgi:hypothetical protein